VYFVVKSEEFINHSRPLAMPSIPQTALEVIDKASKVAIAEIL
jgi:hypothetical protein